MFPKNTSSQRILITIITALIILLGSARPALADGVIIPDPPPWPEPLPLEETWLTIRYHRVSITIEDQVAITRVEQEFLNEHNWEAEGTYIFPLPEGAAVSKFSMWVDGTPVEGQILEADEARQIYEDIVRERRDPALLEYVGQSAVKARIFPIPPGGSRKIELEYTQVLPVENGLVRYVYPLNTEKFSARPLEDCSVRVDLRSDDPMRAIYSPTHQDRIYIARDGDFHATIGYEENNILPDQDFELVYTISQEEVGLNLLTHFPPSGDGSWPREGFFLLMVAPTVEVEHIIPRDVILILDTSGSMDGEKLAQAKEALSYVLQRLNKEDRFNVITFSTGLKRYANELRPVSEAAKASEWVQSLQALGGTNINLALLDALSLVKNHESAQDGFDRPTVLIFLTDGLPTEGVLEIKQILANVEATAPASARLFPFGVGNDVNTVLLDTLAEQNRGTTGYVRPHESITEEVSALYAKIKTPVLTDIALDFGGVIIEDIYPYTLPDLFAGEQLILTGRYRLPTSPPTSLPAGEGSLITLTGQVNGEEREFIYQGVFDACDENDFIPRLWATRKIGYLLTQIRLHGENEEWVSAIVDLSVRYGIITPYTSFLIQEEDILTSAGREEAAHEYMAMPTAPVVGAPAAEKAEAESDMRGAGSAAPLSTGPVNDETGKSEPIVQHVGEKTFLLQDGVWIDTTFDPETMNSQQVGFGTETYFELLAARPDWGDYLALGERVIFVAKGTIYEVVAGDAGAETVDIPAAAPPISAQSPTSEPTSTPDDGGSTLCPGSMAMGLMVLGLGVIWKRRW